MNDLEAMKNAAALGNAFAARDDVIRAYALAFKGYDNALMAQAVEYAVENCERLPTVKGVIAMYRKAEQMARTEAASEGVPCAYCKAEGGWRVQGSTRLVKEIRTAVAPYLPGIMVKDDTGMILGPAWGRLPACASHGLEVARKQGHGGWESPRVKEHRDEIREWRDRWEAEHAIAAAAAIEAEVGSPHHPTPKVVPQGPSLAPIGVVEDSPGVAKLRRVLDEVNAVTRPPPEMVVDVPRPLVETLTDILSLGRMSDCEVAALPSDEKPPPMTADEEADFDRGIRF